MAIACMVLPTASFGQTRDTLPPDSPFRGGIPQGMATPDTLSLSIAEVIKRALDHNLGVLLAEEGANGGAGARTVALSELLPNVSGSISGARRKSNLEAFGFPLRDEFPRIVGPFSVFDARVFLSQTVLDMSTLNEFRASEHSLTASRHAFRSARDLVVLVAANAYLQTIAAAARADTARAQLETATTLHQQAINLRAGGLVAGIDVIRAEVRLSTERQRVTAAVNEYEKSKLQLARVIGLPVGQSFSLSQEIPFVPVPEMTLEEALERAYRDRPDYLAALERVQAAEASRKAIQGEALPSLRLSADYGAIGLHWSDALPTFNVVGEVKVPIFEGGRVQGRLAQADAELRTRRAEADDARAEIYYDVRTAFLDLNATEEVLQTATRARELADLQLTQSRDRFAAGVASNIEVVQSQEAVALASEQYISAMYGFNLAKAMLARSLGTAEEAVAKYLGGPSIK
ncbi:MAG TPA: TolC family protein [Vicinamibacterales bacterium]|nr:TolC family protein [Vicinamibacterales bacterium]